MSTANVSHFLASLHAELNAQASRVRDIIGEKHWLSDGKHKESLVSELLARHLPHGFKVSSGFAISPTDDRLITKELDITVIDCRSEAPLLDQFNFSICFATRLAAMVSVKSAFTKASFKSTLENWASVAVTCGDAASRALLPSLNAVFFDEAIDASALAGSVAKWYDEDATIRRVCARLDGYRLVISTTGNAVAITRQEMSEEHVSTCLVFYRCDRQAIAILLSDIQAQIASRTGNSSTELSLLMDRHTEAAILNTLQLDSPSKHS